MAPHGPCSSADVYRQKMEGLWCGGRRMELGGGATGEDNSAKESTLLPMAFPPLHRSITFFPFSYTPIQLGGTKEPRAFFEQRTQKGRAWTGCDKGHHFKGTWWVTEMLASCFSMKTLMWLSLNFWGKCCKGKRNEEEEQEAKAPLYPKPRELEGPSSANSVQFTWMRAK